MKLLAATLIAVALAALAAAQDTEAKRHIPVTDRDALYCIQTDSGRTCVDYFILRARIAGEGRDDCP